MNLRDAQILVTGANGFIGGRLAARLIAEEGARVRALVRAGTASAQNFIGDVTDHDAVRRAMQDCDAVVHCAAMQWGRAHLDEYRRVNVGGTLNLLRAAHDAHVARFIHLSTINAHGLPPPRDANAASPLTTRGDFYSVSKAEGEHAARAFANANGVPLVVIRPGCTYGPNSQAWTITPLQRVRYGKRVLVGDGNGICNAVYIDNLVDLILLALKNDAAIGHAFIGTEGRGVTWREFYGAYAQMLGGKEVKRVPRLPALLLASAFELLARMQGYPPRIALSSVHFYSHRVVFDISKATQILGYSPRISFAEGMRRTREWLGAKGYLDNFSARVKA